MPEQQKIENSAASNSNSTIADKKSLKKELSHTLTTKAAKKRIKIMQ
jgi:hypothetical protein